MVLAVCDMTSIKLSNKKKACAPTVGNSMTHLPVPRKRNKPDAIRHLIAGRLSVPATRPVSFFSSLFLCKNMASIHSAWPAFAVAVASADWNSHVHVCIRTAQVLNTHTHTLPGMEALLACFVRAPAPARTGQAQTDDTNIFLPGMHRKEGTNAFSQPRGRAREGVCACVGSQWRTRSVC